MNANLTYSCFCKFCQTNFLSINHVIILLFTSVIVLSSLPILHFDIMKICVRCKIVLQYFLSYNVLLYIFCVIYSETGDLLVWCTKTALTCTWISDVTTNRFYDRSFAGLLQFCGCNDCYTLHSKKTFNNVLVLSTINNIGVHNNTVVQHAMNWMQKYAQNKIQNQSWSSEVF